MFYILENKQPKEVSLEEFAEWSRDPSNKIIKRTYLNSKLISTVFLGLDHNYRITGDPILFETAIFETDSMRDLYLERATTFDNALKTHEKVVQAVADDEIENL